MSMQDFPKVLLNHCGKDVSIDKSQYVMQVYNSGLDGNIKRKDEMVLCRFHVDNLEQLVWFYFAKEDAPKEFSYSGYYVSMQEDLSAVKALKHKDALELYKVLSELLVTH